MKKALLLQLLANKPADTTSKVSNAFTNVPCDFEFAVSVAKAQVQKHMDDANRKGFVAWCNQDSKSAVIYGAGLVSRDIFADCMTWINAISAHKQEDPALVHFMAKDGEKLVEIK